MESRVLAAKPFYLSDEEIHWVEKTLDTLDTRKKVGQLFCPMVSYYPDEIRDRILSEVSPGGMMARQQPKEDMWRDHKNWQDASEIPLLIPANLESGGVGVATDGTLFANQMGVAATDSTDMAYRLGLVSGREASAVGCNWAFAPVIDIDMNFQNPITNVRTYGSDPAKVKSMARAYIRGLKESGIAPTIKHWPGDGTDDRDQHLIMTKNLLSLDEWFDTYGEIYQDLIDEGVPTVMAAHIAFPAYMKKVAPDLDLKNILPATLCPELNFGLLRQELGFNGLVTTDATIMFGLTAKGKRSDLVPETIAAGCDMFLFCQDFFEDYQSMLTGVENGVITQARLDEAVTRILALKAMLKLPQKKKEESLVPGKSGLDSVGCQEHLDWSRDCARAAITLVKDTQNLLPISPQKHKKILLFGFGELRGIFGNEENPPVTKALEEALIEKGFEVILFEAEKIGGELLLSSAKAIREAYDLALYFAVIPPYSNAGTLRIAWVPPLGFDIPWFLNEIPVMFISCANPYHLYDVADVRTFINTYTYSPIVLEELLEKITGASPFTGKNPVDPFCGLDEARL